VVHLQAAATHRVRPAELDLLDEVLAEQQVAQARLVQQHADQVARADYEARLARKQYDAVDPENRLVAAELERRWELALRALAEAREAAERVAAQPAAPTLEPALKVQLRALGTHLPGLWDSGRLRPEQKKQLLRTLIRRVVLLRPVPDQVEVKIVWISGAVTVATVRPPVLHEADVSGYGKMVERALALADEGYTDHEIARRLTAEGFHSARSERVADKQVLKIRRAAGQRTLRAQFRGLERFEGQWTILGLARRLGVERTCIYRRITTGTIPATRHPVTGNYVVVDEPRLLERLAAELRPKRNVRS
jgi:hypothetical protein